MFKGQTLYTSEVVGGKKTHVEYVRKLGLVVAIPLIVKSKAKIVFKVEFQTSFRHSRITFF